MDNKNTFEKALDFTLIWEGGFSNHPNDKGGPTNFGITQAVYDSYLLSKNETTKSVANITQGEVKDIYKSMYWDEVEKWGLPEAIAIAAFDFAVHSGHNRSLKNIQICLNIPGDGIYGNETKNALEAVVDKKDLLECYLARRKNFLVNIAKDKNKVFLHGWMNRIRGLREYLKTL